MKDIETVESIVKAMLESKPMTRNSDTILYCEVCRYMNPEACDLPFYVVFRERAKLGLPKYDTVGRARRKLQADNEALQATDDVTDERYENWKAVRRYAIE